MPKTKDWTDEDRARALEWIDGKAKTAAIFKGQETTVSERLDSLHQAPVDNFADAVRGTLTDQAWQRLLNALRQRKHKARADGSGLDSKPDDEPVPVPTLDEDAEKDIRAFYDAFDNLRNRLHKVMRSGAILKIRETHRAECERFQRESTYLGPHCGITVYPMGHALIVEMHEYAGSIMDAEREEKSGFTREGCILIKVGMEPVRTHQERAPAGDLHPPTFKPDTWANAAKYMTFNPEDYIVRVGA